MAAEFYTFNEAFAGMTAVCAGAWSSASWSPGCHMAQGGPAGPDSPPSPGRAVVLAAPYLRYALQNYPNSLTKGSGRTSPCTWFRLVLPSSDKLFGLDQLISYSNNLGRSDLDDYVGLPLLLVPVALVVFARRNRIARLLAIVLAFVIALAVGPILVVGNMELVHLPWGRLWSLPIARSAEPSRFIIFAVLVLSIALAVWLAAPTTSRLLRAARWGLGLLAVVVLFADSPTSYQAVNPVPLGYQPPGRPCVRSTSCRRLLPMACTGSTWLRGRSS